eukprot:TRINITY_DN1068_c3_g3_i1.p1 TRINITY_DN1068_c3_g3~~TRINITY_DN1068_c3_g3_i1.p1  ORF type:complete len:693 (+),score=152.34 TRINITY_DN1068_c3_g3_i1:89-2167(+)
MMHRLSAADQVSKGDLPIDARTAELVHQVDQLKKQHDAEARATFLYQHAVAFLRTNELNTLRVLHRFRKAQLTQAQRTAFERFMMNSPLLTSFHVALSDVKDVEDAIVVWHKLNSEQWHPCAIAECILQACVSPKEVNRVALDSAMDKQRHDYDFQLKLRAEETRKRQEQWSKMSLLQRQRSCVCDGKETEFDRIVAKARSFGMTQTETEQLIIEEAETQHLALFSRTDFDTAPKPPDTNPVAPLAVLTKPLVAICQVPESVLLAHCSEHLLRQWSRLTSVEQQRLTVHNYLGLVRVNAFLNEYWSRVQPDQPRPQLADALPVPQVSPAQPPASVLSLQDGAVPLPSTIATLHGTNTSAGADRALPGTDRAAPGTDRAPAAGRSFGTISASSARRPPLPLSTLRQPGVPHSSAVRQTADQTAALVRTAPMRAQSQQQVRPRAPPLQQRQSMGQQLPLQQQSQQQRASAPMQFIQQLMQQGKFTGTQQPPVSTTTTGVSSQQQQQQQQQGLAPSVQPHDIEPHFQQSATAMRQHAVSPYGYGTAAVPGGVGAGAYDTRNPMQYGQQYGQFGQQSGQYGQYGQYGQSRFPYGQSQLPYGQSPYGQLPYGQSPYGQSPYGQFPQHPSARYGTGVGYGGTAVPSTAVPPTYAAGMMTPESAAAATVGPRYGASGSFHMHPNAPYRRPPPRPSRSQL